MHNLIKLFMWFANFVNLRILCSEKLLSYTKILVKSAHRTTNGSNLYSTQILLQKKLLFSVWQSRWKRNILLGIQNKMWKGKFLLCGDLTDPFDCIFSTILLPYSTGGPRYSQSWYLRARKQGKTANSEGKNTIFA